MLFKLTLLQQGSNAGEVTLPRRAKAAPYLAYLTRKSGLLARPASREPRYLEGEVGEEKRLAQRSASMALKKA